VFRRFQVLARQETARVLAALPEDPLARFVVFIEMTRAIDYWTISREHLDKPHTLSTIEFQLLQMGWNLAVEHTFSELPTANAFPLAASTVDTIRSATRLLHGFGCAVLMGRVAEMVRLGFLGATRKGSRYDLVSAPHVTDQFFDTLEATLLRDLEKKLAESSDDPHGQWKLVEEEDLDSVQKQAGAFFLRPPSEDISSISSDTIQEVMADLVHPWRTTRGTMMGYGADPRVDDYFFDKATRLLLEWRSEAGLHPDATLSGVSGGEITVVVGYLLALGLKHVEFAGIAVKKYPEISLSQSLTLWEPREMLVDAITDHSGLSRERVDLALNAITLTAADKPRLYNSGVPMLPPLIDLGNGLILRPLSGFGRNPFIPVFRLAEWRNPNTRHELAARREAWQREDLYALFQGWRYQTVKGSTRLRDRGKAQTDVDAAIYDNVTGAVALFQFKWQDYFTHDARALKSKASNLSNELLDWSNAVDAWLRTHNTAELAATLRLRLPRGSRPTAVYMFAISRTIANTRGYGVEKRIANLADGSWPQFVRLRHEVGPAANVFHELFQGLRSARAASPAVQGMPVTLPIGGYTVHLADLWYRTVDDETAGR
jgi:hypothetical protein